MTETTADLRSPGIPIDDIRSRDLSWNHIIAELVDNSLDAKARRVEIIINKRILIVGDDGIGVEDTKALLIYGRHDPHASTQAGRFGVGAKLALYRGDQIDIKTIRDGFRHSISLAVPALRRDASNIPWPSWHPTHEPSGTTITIGKIPTYFAEIRLREVRGFLSKTYAPGIQDGRQLLIGKERTQLQPIVAWKSPIQTDIRETEHDFGDGRHLRCRAGLILDPKAEGRGTFAAYGFRHLDDTQLGLEESPGARIHVALTLTEDRKLAWHLDTNKRKLLEVHANEVSAFLQPFLQPLIDKEREKRRNLKIDGANLLLELAFNSTGSGLGFSTPRPGAGQVVGGPWGQGSGSPPDPPHLETNSPKTRKRTRQSTPPPGLQIIPDQLPNNEAFRYAESSRKAEVRFNTDHLLWQQIGENEQALASWALLIYEYSQLIRSLQPKQRGLPLDDNESDPVGKSFGSKLSTITIMNVAARTTDKAV